MTTKSRKALPRKGSPSAIQPAILKKLKSQIWPQERDFFERPDRLKYVRKVIQNDSCVFCDAVEKGCSFESLILWNSPKTIVIMNKYPYNTGHLLILPHRHVGDFKDLSNAEYAEMMQILRQSSTIVRDTYSCAGFNIGLNHGKIAGAGIPEHLHWHIIPRWQGDTNFFPLIAETKVLPETLEQSYYILKPKFDKLSL
jgi:ATP adenylyltransferase